MPLEIERKFLVAHDSHAQSASLPQRNLGGRGGHCRCAQGLAGDLLSGRIESSRIMLYNDLQQ